METQYAACVWSPSTTTTKAKIALGNGTMMPDEWIGGDDGGGAYTIQMGVFYFNWNHSIGA